MIKTKYPFNTVALSKKYKCDVGKLVRFWKKDKSDFEISQSLGIDMMKVMQIRQEIAYMCEKERQQRQKRSFPSRNIFTNKPR